jgi:lipopolysaccharide transport system permease protein
MTTVIETVRFAWSSRRAWWFIASARTRARYARTALGSLWLGLSNLLSIAVLSIVYGTVFQVPDFNAYVVYLGAGLVVWNSMASAIGSAPSLFDHNSSHLHNTNLPPIFYTLEEWAFQVQTFLQSLVLVLLALTFFQPTVFPNLLTVGLLPLVNILLFVYWLPLVLCLVGARFHDMFQLVPIVLQLLFLVSPILYKKDTLGNLSWTADFNPLFRVLSPLRHSLLHGELMLNDSLLLLLINLLGILLGVILLERQRRVLPFLV